MGTKKITARPWNWEDAVFMYGIQVLHRVTGAERYKNYLSDWIEHHLERGVKIGSSDSLAPCSTVAYLSGISNPANTYGSLLLDAKDYLANRVSRTPDGGINHLGSLEELGVTLWVDSLFMFGGYLTRLSDAQSNSAELQELGQQFTIFASHLQSPNGLFLHAHNWALETDSSIFWLRGNGWVTAMGYEYLRLKRNFLEEADEVSQILKKQVDMLVTLQDPSSGLWWTLLNVPEEGYVEISGSALILFGMARGYRYGFLGDEILPVLEKGRDGLLKFITQKNGLWSVHQVSGPTNAGTRKQYLNVRTDSDIPYGVGAALMALVEISGLPLN